MIGRVVDVLIARQGDVDQVRIAIEPIERVPALIVDLDAPLADGCLLFAPKGDQQHGRASCRGATHGLVDHLARHNAVERLRSHGQGREQQQEQRREQHSHVGVPAGFLARRVCRAAANAARAAAISRSISSSSSAVLPRSCCSAWPASASSARESCS